MTMTVGRNAKGQESQSDYSLTISVSKHDVVASPDRRKTKLKDTCPDDVKNDCRVVERDILESLGRHTLIYRDEKNVGQNRQRLC